MTDEEVKVSERHEKAFYALFKEFGITKGEHEGHKGLTFNSKSREDTQRTIANLVYFNCKLLEAALKMYITVEADGPNQELVLAKRFHELMTEAIDKILTDFMEEVLDKKFIYKKERVDL